MYYAHFILNKKGPLAKIWLAAHWDKKLTKAQIYETNIESTIETILEPQMKLALRTSGHLLLGVCRIYSRKVKYLLADCNEAFVKIKLAFRPGLIDLPKEKQQASVEAITLPEKFPEFSMLVDINMEDMDLSKNLHQQARIEDITLKEDFGTFVATQDDDFGDMGSFGMDMDTFMMSDMEKGRRFENSLAGGDGQEIDFFDDPSAFAGNDMDINTSEKNMSHANDLNADLNSDQALNNNDMSALMPNKIGDFSSNLENPDNLPEDETMIHENEEHNDLGLSTVAEMANLVPTLFDDQPTVMNKADDEDVTAAKKQKLNSENEQVENNNTEKKAPNEDDDTNSEVSDLLKKPSEPLKTVEKQIRTRRRRKLIIDEVKEIDSATMKAQLSDTSNILGSLEMAPPTRQLMILKENGGVDKLFSMTSRPLYSKVLQKLYTRNMTTKSLADITNSTKQLSISSKDQKGNNTVANIVINNSNMNNDLSLARENNEPSLHENHQTSKDELPLADSFIDDTSKRHTMIDVTTDNNLIEQQNRINDLDEFDQFGGPASIFNQGDNLDLLLDEYPNQINLELTPNKLDTTEKNKKSDETIAADSDEDEEEEGNKTTSPKRKRSYKRSMNTTNKENLTHKDDGDAEEIDDTLTNDPTKNLNKRAKTLISILNKNFAKNDNVGFFELIKRNGKKSVVQKFYSLLVLRKYEIIEVSQEETYGDIIINKGDKFENFVA